MKRCGSKKTKTGKPCGRLAGWGTEHSGEGLCRSHDPDTPSDRPLTEKQLRFIDEYPIDCNATQAARRSGYSKKTAYAIGHENLSKPEISEKIKKRLDNYAMSREEALKRLADMARASWMHFIKVEGGRIWFNLADDEAQKHLHLIRKIKSKRNFEGDNNKKWEVEWVEVELHDAKDAIDKILRAHGAYSDTLDINHSGKVEVIDFRSD